ncbi:hypothetical protein SCHPADRAFT_897290, partial [Schizopora paradoxa]
DPSLDLVWSDLELEDFEHIFAILAPLEPLYIPEQPPNAVTRVRFSRRLSHLDWKRFIPYASRVKLVDCFYRDGGGYGILDESAYADLLLTKPLASPLFPRARQLYVDGRFMPYSSWFQVFVSLLHEDLQSLSLYAFEDAVDEVRDFLGEAVWRSPNIVKLYIEGTFGALDRNIGDSLSSSIAKLHRLTTVPRSLAFLLSGKLRRTRGMRRRTAAGSTSAVIKSFGIRRSLFSVETFHPQKFKFIVFCHKTSHTLNITV